VWFEARILLGLTPVQENHRKKTAKRSTFSELKIYKELMDVYKNFHEQIKKNMSNKRQVKISLLVPKKTKINPSQILQ